MEGLGQEMPVNSSTFREDVHHAGMDPRFPTQQLPYSLEILLTRIEVMENSKIHSSL